MNRAEKFGIASFAIASGSAIPYLIGVWSGDFRPSLTSWILWTMIGLVMLLSYRSAGATRENIWMGIVAFTNPLAVVLVRIYKGGAVEPPTSLEWVAAGVCAIALFVWSRGHRSPDHAKTALVASIVADVCAAIPTTLLAWSAPLSEQPIPWSLYVVAMVVGLFSITKRTWDQYALPVYGLLLGLSVAVPTIVYRLLSGPGLPWF